MDLTLFALSGFLPPPEVGGYYVVAISDDRVIHSISYRRITFSPSWNCLLGELASSGMPSTFAQYARHSAQHNLLRCNRGSDADQLL